MDERIDHGRREATPLLPRAVTDEHRLLAKMTTVGGIAEVTESGVHADVFVEPLLRYLFGQMVDYFAKHKSPPTPVMLDEEYLAATADRGRGVD